MPKGITYIPSTTKRAKQIMQAKGTGVKRFTNLTLMEKLKREEQQQWNKLQDMKKVTKAHTK